MKLSVFVDDIFVYINNRKEPKANLLLTRYFNNVAGYKINISLC